MRRKPCSLCEIEEIVVACSPSYLEGEDTPVYNEGKKGKQKWKYSGNRYLWIKDTVEPLNKGHSGTSE